MHPTHEPVHGEDDQLWIGWKWFELHSKQRIESFKFFGIVYGAMISLSVALLHPSTIFVASLLSAMSALVSIVFWQLDARNLQLIEIGERMIGERWGERGFPDARNPQTLAAIKHSTGLRYKYAFLLTFASALCFSIFFFSLTVYLINYPGSYPTAKIH